MQTPNVTHYDCFLQLFSPSQHLILLHFPCSRQWNTWVEKPALNNVSDIFWELIGILPPPPPRQGPDICTSLQQIRCWVRFPSANFDLGGVGAFTHFFSVPQLPEVSAVLGIRGLPYSFWRELPGTTESAPFGEPCVCWAVACLNTPLVRCVHK